MSDSSKIRFSLHIPIVCVVLALHFYASDIFTYFYLKGVKNQLSQKHLTGKLYLKGDYEPLLRNDPYRNLPENHVFVFVSENKGVTEEIYYTDKGQKVEALYIRGKIKQISGSSPSKMVFFIVPLVGLLLAGFSILHEMVRTGKVFTWQLGKSQDNLEMLCNLYGLPFTFAGIFIVVIKELWMK